MLCGLTKLEENRNHFDYNNEYNGDGRELPGDIRFDDGSILIEGDYCINSQKGIHGVCTASRRCPEVVADYHKNGIIPIICSYLTNDAIVCCPQTQQQVNLINRDSPTRKSEQSMYFF